MDLLSLHHLSSQGRTVQGTRTWTGPERNRCPLTNRVGVPSDSQRPSAEGSLVGGWFVSVLHHVFEGSRKRGKRLVETLLRYVSESPTTCPLRVHGCHRKTSHCMGGEPNERNRQSETVKDSSLKILVEGLFEERELRGGIPDVP